MAKHYIRIDENTFITHGFSDDIRQHREQLLDTDICINETGGRHFTLNGIVNPPLKREDGLPKYKYDLISGEVLETTNDDLANQLQRIDHKDEMYQLEQELGDEDWKVSRQYSSDDEDHLMPESDYTAFKAKRDTARGRIDEIRELLKGM